MGFFFSFMFFSSRNTQIFYLNYINRPGSCGYPQTGIKIPAPIAGQKREIVMTGPRIPKMEETALRILILDCIMVLPPKKFIWSIIQKLVPDCKP